MKIFLDHEDKFENSLIIFQSAGIPGTIDRFLSKLLVKQNLLIATAFRDDWEIDDFLSSKRKRMVTCNNQNAKIALELFFEFFHIDIYFLNSIKEAEILANASLSITSIINGFLNELCFAYPNTNLKDFSKMILENLPLDEISLSIGLSRYKLANASNNLIEGSKKEDGLSILKISNSFNLSLILYYGDLIAKKGCKKVAIYGVSGEGDLKEIRVSASVILAEYLKNLGLEVYLNDPLFDNSELESILPFTKIFNLVDKADVECVIFMAPHNEYKYLTQKDLKEMGILNCEIIIDNTEFFKDYIFDEKTIYHIAGDGKLSELEL
jgi:UDP-N-acetyl-D-mannosaminuronate dehydrogenase